MKKRTEYEAPTVEIVTVDMTIDTLTSSTGDSPTQSFSNLFPDTQFNITE